MASTFLDYNFRLGMLSVSDKGMITVSVPVFAKDAPIKLRLSRCHIKGQNGCESTFTPQPNDEIVLNARGIQRINFSFPHREINRYSEGARIDIELIDEGEEKVVVAGYVYGRSSGWSLTEVFDYYLEAMDDNDLNLYDDEDKFLDLVEEGIDWESTSQIERIEKKTNLKELGTKEIEGFCCHYCIKEGSEDGYLLVEQVDVDLAEFIEDEFVWGEFQKVIYQEFEFKKHISGTIYVIFLIHKGNTAIPIQKIEGYRKYGRKYVFTESEIVNFISGLNYTFELDKNLNPVESWVAELKPINLTGIISNAYLSKHVENYLDGETFDDYSLFQIGNNGRSKDISNVPIVKKVSSIEMGDFRQFCFGSMRQIEFGEINLFYGANGSGKTSILEALEYGFTAEIRRMKDFKVKYGNDRYPKISVVDAAGISSTFTPTTSKGKAKEIERVWYGVPTGRTKTTLNEQFNRFNYFDSEAAYKFIHAKDQNEEAFEELFSNLLFGEEIVGYEKKWKRFKQAFDDSYSRLREELNTAEFWVGVYKEALTRTSGPIDVSSVYREGKRIYLVDTHGEISIALERLKAIKIDMEAITTAVNEFKGTISYEPGMSLSIIKKDLQERKNASEQLLSDVKRLRDEINTVTELKNLVIDRLQGYKGDIQQLQTILNEYEEAYEKFLLYKGVLESTDKIERLIQSERELEKIQADCDLIFSVENNTGIQFLLEESERKVLHEEMRTEYERLLAAYKEKLLSLKNEYKRIQEQNDQKKNDLLGLQRSGISFLQKYGTAKCPLCGEEYGSQEELKGHIERVEQGEDDNIQLLKDISEQEQKIEECQLILYRDDKLTRAYTDLQGMRLPESCAGNEEKIKYIYSLLQNKQLLLNRREELTKFIAQLECDGLNHSSIAKANNFAQQNHVYLGFTEQNIDTTFEKYYENRTRDISARIEEIKRLINEAESQQLRIDSDLDSKMRALSTAQTSDIQAQYIQLRNLYLVFNPIREKFNIPESADLYQWVIDFEAFCQMINQNISTVESYSNVEFEKEQAREYQRQSVVLKAQLSRCQAAVSALNRMPSLKTFVTDIVQANIQRISYYFRWMHHSGEFESLGIDEVGVYAIRGVDNRLVRVYEMSTGQRTSLAFSVMLAFYSVADTAPKCLLLDEPLATMDNVQVGNALDIIKSLADQGTQIFFTSASLDTIKLFQNFFRNTSFDYREFEFVKRINGTVKINNNQFSATANDDSDAFDVENLYVRYEHSLADVIRMYPNTLQNKQQLQGVLKDIFPGENVRINLLLQAYDQGIYDDISTTQVLHSPFAYKHKKRLMENYGISNEFADWAVTVWCIAYGSMVLNKTCEIKNPVTHI